VVADEAVGLASAEVETADLETTLGITATLASTRWRCLSEGQLPSDAFDNEEPLEKSS